jgi:hypothetical protein
VISESDLIDELSRDGLGWARFDKDRRYRFRLGRKLTPQTLNITWGEIIAFGGFGLSRVVFLMLNPSTANAFKPDPTVDRCCEFARRWGADVLEVVNLFAFISTDPRELTKATVPGWAPIEACGGGVKNNMEILAACRGATRVVAAWGTGGSLYERDQRVIHLLDDHDIELSVLRLTKEGHPNHPLSRGKNFIPYETVPRAWKGELVL